MSNQTNARVRLAYGPRAFAFLAADGSVTVFLRFPFDPRRAMPTRFTPGHTSQIAMGDCQPGDEQVGAYSYEQRVRMNDRFVERVERAIAAGKERRPNGEAPERAA